MIATIPVLSITTFHYDLDSAEIGCDWAFRDFGSCAEGEREGGEGEKQADYGAGVFKFLVSAWHCIEICVVDVCICVAGVCLCFCCRFCVCVVLFVPCVHTCVFVLHLCL